MNQLHRENELRLSILEAIARSQQALANIIESVAAARDRSIVSADNEQAARELEALARYQLVLAEKILSLKLRHIRNGEPGKPWLSSKVCRSSGVDQPRAPMLHAAMITACRGRDRCGSSPQRSRPASIRTARSRLRGDGHWAH